MEKIIKRLYIIPNKQFQKHEKEDTKKLLPKTFKKIKAELDHSLITFHKNTKHVKKRLLKQIKINYKL